jgi:hypothetical protein
MMVMTIVATGQVTVTDLNDAKQLVMYIGASQSRTVIYDGVSTYTPNYSTSNQVLTPQLYIAGGGSDVSAQAKSTTWYVQPNGTGTPTQITTNDSNYTLGTTQPITLTIKSNVLASNRTMTYICEMVYTDPDTNLDVTTKAEIELVKVTNGTNGQNAITGVLSNESATVPADPNGNVTSFGGAVSTLTIYNGATDDTANWTITQTTSGLTATASGSPANRTATITAMSADTGTVTFTATRSGYPTITKVFTVTKSKQGSTGSAGQNATSYWLVNPPAIVKTKSGTYNPATITVSANSQTGTASPTAYAGRFIISESTDGTTFTDKYTSSANESSKTYTPSAGIKSVRVRLYQAGGTSTLLDEQIIPVVSDGVDGANGANGADAFFANVWTPDGAQVRNGNGTVSAQIDLYKGGTTVTPTAFKWYIQDPTATTSNGGDADGGNGWRLLTSSYNLGITGYTTAKITIPASAIAGVESFKCVATYNSQKYSGVTTVSDISDPILVRIDGVNIFKNGQGTITLTATLLQAGVEIDQNGTQYTYTWSIYDSNGNKTSFNKTGKTITVNATDINGIANIVCDVS